MRLRELFGDDATIEARAAATTVTGLAVDSRAVKPGDLFFALAGSKTDGARFIDAAIAAGAVAIIGDRMPPGEQRVPFVTSLNPRRALARAAAKLYPRQPAVVAAVTGKRFELVEGAHSLGIRETQSPCCSFQELAAFILDCSLDGVPEIQHMFIAVVALRRRPVCPLITANRS